MNFHIVLKYVWGSHADSSLRVADIFHLSVAKMSGVGTSLAVWSYLPVYSSFYFSISSMNTGTSFIRTTNNDVPLTISLLSVSTKSIEFFSYQMKCWIVLNALYKLNFYRNHRLRFLLMLRNCESMFLTFPILSLKKSMRYAYRSKIAFSWNSFVFAFSLVWKLCAFQPL